MLSISSNRVLAWSQSIWCSCGFKTIYADHPQKLLLALPQGAYSLGAILQAQLLLGVKLKSLVSGYIVNVDSLCDPARGWSQ